MATFLSPDPIGFNGGDSNYYRYVKNNAINFVDPNGLARFGKCKLSGKDRMVTNELLDMLNLELAHEQLFFDDEKGGNIGYFDSGIHENTENRSEYTMDSD